MKLSCSQIKSLLTFYVNDKLNDNIKEIVEEHIEKCSSCREKYQTILNITLQFVKAKEYIDSIKPVDKTSEGLSEKKDYALVQNLSAYSDNELSDEDSLKVKKYVIKNLNARQSLEEIYELRNIIKKSFEKYESQIKDDFSKNVLNKLELEEEIKRGGSKLKVASVLIFVLTSFTVCIVYILTNSLI